MAVSVFGGREQELVREFFGAPGSGFFVEVGANQPQRESQTWHLEQVGWTGILIEPQPKLAGDLRRMRSAKVFAFACSSPENAGRQMRLYVAGALSSLDRDRMAPGAEPEWIIEVPVRTLDDILSEAGAPMRFDFLSIDVEGHELEVLHGFDFARWRPRLVLLEDHVGNLAKHRFLKNAGYRLIRRYGNNGWYVPRETVFHVAPRERWNILRKYYLGLPFRMARNASRRVRRRMRQWWRTRDRADRAAPPLVASLGERMRILAFHPGCHDSSAALFEDYKLVAAVDEERLTRRKGSGDGVPWLAIDEVLRIGGCSRAEIDAIVATRSFFPWQYFRYPFHKELDYRFRGWLGRDQKLRDLMVHCQLRRTADAKSVFRTGAFLDDHGFRPDTVVQFANHHEAHALASLFYTDWDDALLYTADGVGDNVSYSIRTLKDGQLDCHFGDDRWLLRAGPRCSSLAWAYGYATKACGFTMFRHEGKLTGLAACGEPILADEIASHFWIDNHGMINASFADDRAIERMIARVCYGHARETIAASIQKVVEDLTLRSVRYWLSRARTRHLGLAGGLFANVRLNRLLAENCPIDEIFIYPAMSDGGLSVGAGLSFLLARDGLQTWLAERYRLDDLYFGFNYHGRIDEHLAQAGAKPLPGAPAQAATELLRSGKVGAAYIGRMEFGPRALGARSILANPANLHLNHELNRRLERSEFMPFAPCVLDEDCERVFEITPVNRYAMRFMTITCAVRPEWHDRIPAVIHVDGTARPQVVRDRENPLYADILRHFRAATGLPVLVNTSFNVHEEPIVNSPAECVKALRGGRIDFVVTDQATYALS